MAKIICLSCFKELTELEKVFSCSRRHQFCAPCGKTMHLQCECYESLQLLTLKNAEENSSGVECLGHLLKIWQCNWSGSKKEFQEHFVRCHNNIEIFSQFQVSSVPFRGDQLLSAMTLVRAFDSSFIFYYHTNPSAKMIYFLIFLLDNDEQPKPESFIYELMIKSPGENHCKIKFVEKCFVLDDDVTRLRDNELCAAATFQTIQKHLFEDHIHFSFIIKKNGKESLNVGSPPSASKKEACKTKPAPHVVPNKGSVKANNVMKSPSIPDVKATGGGVAKKEPTSAELDLMKSPPDYSSINKTSGVQTVFASPALSTASLKRNDVELQRGTSQSDDPYHLPNIICQSYKACGDSKIYRQKYPKSCLSKPRLKK